MKVSGKINGIIFEHCTFKCANMDYIHKLNIIHRTEKILNAYYMQRISESIKMLQHFSSPIETPSADGFRKKRNIF